LDLTGDIFPLSWIYAKVSKYQEVPNNARTLEGEGTSERGVVPGSCRREGMRDT